jgi:hypothetical protein
MGLVLSQLSHGRMCFCANQEGNRGHVESDHRNNEAHKCSVKARQHHIVSDIEIQGEGSKDKGQSIPATPSAMVWLRASFGRTPRSVLSSGSQKTEAG